jgi:hypothetical protein
MTVRRRLHSSLVVTLVLVCLAVTGIIALRTPRFNPDASCCDHLFYRSMAFNFFSVTRPDLDRPPPGNPLIKLQREHAVVGGARLQQGNGLRRQRPFAYRVLTPLSARLLFTLTGDINNAFYLLSFLAIAGSCLFVALTIFSITGSLIPALAGALAFCLNPWTARFNLFDFMLGDPLTFFCVALAIFGLFRRRPALFYVACLAGAFNKELILPLVLAYPLSEVFSDHEFQPERFVPALAIGVAWLAFRLMLPVPAAHYSVSDQFAAYNIGVREVLSVVAMLLVPLWRGFRSRITWALTPFIVLNVAAGIFVGAVQGRHIVQLLPVLIPLMLIVWPRATVARVMTLLPLGVYGGQIIYFFHQGAQPLVVSYLFLLKRQYLFPTWVLVALISALVLNELTLRRLLRKQKFAWLPVSREEARA